MTSDSATDGTLSRDDLLSVSPRAVLEDGLREPGALDETGLRDALRTLGALTMSEQLRAAGVPREALDLCMVVLDQARERSPGWDAAARDHAVRGLDVSAAGAPALGRWLAELLQAIADRADLDAAIRFLETTRAVWETNRILRERTDAARRP